VGCCKEKRKLLLACRKRNWEVLFSHLKGISAKGVVGLPENPGCPLVPLGFSMAAAKQKERCRAWPLAATRAITTRSANLVPRRLYCKRTLETLL
jgi:hypothetical protein